jgi:hypothetical protein
MASPRVYLLLSLVFTIKSATASAVTATTVLRDSANQTDSAALASQTKHRMGLDGLDCRDCDAGQQCGLCLVLVSASQCPYDGSDHTRCHRGLLLGEMCEGDGECGSDNDADNCLHRRGKERLRDVYRRVECAAQAGERRRSSLLWMLAPLSLVSVMCGALFRAASLRCRRPHAPLASVDAATGVQLDSTPVASGVLIVEVAQGCVHCICDAHDTAGDHRRCPSQHADLVACDSCSCENTGNGSAICGATAASQTAHMATFLRL